MARPKKIITKPKSTLGLDRKAKICFNCLFYNRETGRCPDYIDGKYPHYDWNHRCSFIFGPMYNPDEN